MMRSLVGTGANCIVIEKCRKVTRKKLKILDEDSDYAVTANSRSKCFVHIAFIHLCEIPTPSS